MGKNGVYIITVAGAVLLATTAGVAVDDGKYGLAVMLTLETFILIGFMVAMAALAGIGEKNDNKKEN